MEQPAIIFVGEYVEIRPGMEADVAVTNS